MVANIKYYYIGNFEMDKSEMCEIVKSGYPHRTVTNYVHWPRFVTHRRETDTHTLWMDWLCTVQYSTRMKRHIENNDSKNNRFTGRCYSIVQYNMSCSIFYMPRYDAVFFWRRLVIGSMSLHLTYSHKILYELHAKSLMKCCLIELPHIVSRIEPGSSYSRIEKE